MNRERSLKVTLLILFLVVGLIPMAFVGGIGYVNSNRSVKKEVFRGWELVFNMTKNNLDNYFKRKEKDCAIIAESKEIVDNINYLKAIDWNLNSALWLGKEKEITQFINRAIEVSGDENISILSTDGIVVYSTRNQDIGINLAEQDYFKAAMMGRANWTNIFHSQAFGANVMVYSVPIFREINMGEITGVVVYILAQTGITDIVQGEIKEVSDTADAYLINEEGLLMTASTKAGKGVGLNTYINTKVVDILSSAIRARNTHYFREAEYRGIDGAKTLGMLGVTELGGQHFGFIVEVEAKEVFATLTKTSNIVLILAAIITALIIALSLIFANNITKPIISLMGLMAKAENGDLTVRANIERRDEIGRLSNSFNVMMEGILNSIRAVFDASNRVSDASEDISTSTEQMAAGAQTQAGSVQELTATMEEMGASIQEVSDNIQETAEYSEQVTQSILEMNISIQDIAEGGQIISQEMSMATEALDILGNGIDESVQETRSTNEEVEKAVRIAQAGSEQVEKTISEMASINEAVEDLASAINELGNSASHIGDIIDVIEDIAEQTNLLALNAAIEAARAGEHGKGFAVVAGAIGDLAAKSREATQDIGKLIIGIQREVKAAIKTTEDGTQKVKQGVTSVQQAGEAFQEISDAISSVTLHINAINEKIVGAAEQSLQVQGAVEKVNNLVQSALASTEQQSAATEEIVRIVEKMSELSRDVAASTEEQAASSDEVVKVAEKVSLIAAENSAASEEIASSSEELKSLAEKLIDVVNNFKIE